MRRSAVSRLKLKLLLVGAAALAALLPALGASAESGTTGAGGRAVVHRAGGRVIEDESLAAVAPEARLYPVGHGAVEPTLGITSDGSVFFAAWMGDVMRSGDGGATWENIGPPFGPHFHLISLDPYVYVDDDTDRFFTIDLTVACSYLSFSDDRGHTWTTNPLACGVPVNDHQSLFAGPPVSSPTLGYDNLLYYCFNNIASSYCSKSLDGGITFVPTGEPAFAGVAIGEGQASGFCGGLHGHGVVGPDGTVYLPRGYCDGPFLAVSENEGATWIRQRVAKQEVSFYGDPSVAVDGSGNLYYVFESAVDRLPYLTVSRDHGATWSKPLMVAAPGVSVTHLATVEVGADGKVAVAYMGASGISPRASTFTNARWNGYITMTTDALSADPVFYSASVNDPADPILRGPCGGDTRCPVVLDFIDVEIAPDGTPWAAFVDGCNGACVQRPNPNSDEGIAGRLVGGPSLR